MSGGKIYVMVASLLVWGLIICHISVRSEGTKAIDRLNSCDDFDDDEVDRAKITYYLPDDLQGYNDIDLYATNSWCYHCSKQLVAKGSGGKSDANCASLWTPFYWNLYVVNTSDSHHVVLYSTTHTFGDAGQYDVHPSVSAGSSSGDSLENWALNIKQTKEPYDTLRPLWILFALFFAIACCAFGLPLLITYLKRKGVFGSDNPDLDDQSMKTMRRGAAGGAGGVDGAGAIAGGDSAAAPLLGPDSSLMPSTKTQASDGFLSTSTRSQPAAVSSGAGATVGPGAGAGPGAGPGAGAAKKKPERLRSLDTFRGFSLIVMIFVNYGGGGYWFFEHAPWNGLTVADLLFPWFMWMMGVSMAISFYVILRKNGTGSDSNENQSLWTLRAWLPAQFCGVDTPIWLRVFRRSLILFLIGMFLANGYEYQTWRVPGVLQYFSVSYLVTSCTILSTHVWTQRCKAQILEAEQQQQAYRAEGRDGASRSSASTGEGGGMGGGGESRSSVPASVFGDHRESATSSLYSSNHSMSTSQLDESGISSNVEEASSSSSSGIVGAVTESFAFLLGVIRRFIRSSYVLAAYRYEWAIQVTLLVVYLAITFGAKAPGCPRGYIGPGGLYDHEDHRECTGGIHRYIDMQVFGYDFIYHHPTCLDLYDCIPYDPEGLLGSMGACLLTYLGLMTGRAVIDFKHHEERLVRWITYGMALMLLAGILCGFSQEEGAIPLNKNMWSVSFVFVTAGGGMVLLSACYVLIDVYKIWTGAPFFALGMNSILIYVGHDLLGTYMPFSYMVYDVNHGTLLQMNVLGTFSWVVIAAYLYRIKFFVKI